LNMLRRYLPVLLFLLLLASLYPLLAAQFASLQPGWHFSGYFILSPLTLLLVTVLLFVAAIVYAILLIAGLPLPPAICIIHFIATFPVIYWLHRPFFPFSKAPDNILDLTDEFLISYRWMVVTLCLFLAGQVYFGIMTYRLVRTSVRKSPSLI
jgi:hypothetical protein